MSNTKLTQYINALDQILISMHDSIAGFDIDRFNAYQRGILINLFKNYDNGKHSILIAPTGSGKSIVALLFTYIVSTINSGASIILASDTYLQNQYVDSNKKFTMHLEKMKFAMLKGKSNYTCLQNHMPYTKGICAEREIGAFNALEKMTCAETCPYITAYMSTLKANVKVLNYHLYLTYANYIGDHQIVSNATTMVLDECHKIDDILDSFANSVIPATFLAPMQNALDAIALLIPNTSAVFKAHVEECQQKLINVFVNAIKGSEYATFHNMYLELMSSIINFENDALNNLIYELLDEYGESAKMSTKIPLSVQVIFAYNKFIEKALILYVDAKSIDSDKFVANFDANTKSLTVSNISTADRFQKFINAHTDNPMVFMSATIANAEYYAKHLGLSNDEYDVVNVDSIFDFSKSPIVAVHPMISMSSKNKEQNMSILMTRIDNVIATHSMHNGVVHTANKSIAQYIMQNSEHKHRLLSYSNAVEKHEILKLLNKNTNYVIIAYSMEEGVDLYDDLCRFQYIAKLSWSYLGDNIVKRKMAVYPEWYAMTTLNKLLQTIGRGNRNVNDYCITYTSDTSFSKLVGLMDDNIKARFKDIFYNDVSVDFINNTFNVTM